MYFATNSRAVNARYDYAVVWAMDGEHIRVGDELCYCPNLTNAETVARGMNYYLEATGKKGAQSPDEV
jgi:hypothetical protein